MAKVNLKVTNIKDLARYQEGIIVELPPFAEGQPFVARMKRPSILGLAKQGKIPNQLMTAANGLFSGGTAASGDKGKEDLLKDVYDVIDILCEASFVEPTYQELKDVGVELTDDQLVFIFNYSQKGVTDIKSFRK